MNGYDKKCDCEYEVINTRYATGENLIGIEVTAEVEDLKCKKCGGLSLKVIQADPNFEREELC